MRSGAHAAYNARQVRAQGFWHNKQNSQQTTEIKSSKPKASAPQAKTANPASNPAITETGYTSLLAEMVQEIMAKAQQLASNPLLLLIALINVLPTVFADPPPPTVNTAGAKCNGTDLAFAFTGPLAVDTISTKEHWKKILAACGATPADFFNGGEALDVEGPCYENLEVNVKGLTEIAANVTQCLLNNTFNPMCQAEDEESMQLLKYLAIFAGCVIVLLGALGTAGLIYKNREAISTSNAFTFFRRLIGCGADPAATPLIAPAPVHPPVPLLAASV